jgi:hypothetical protein
MMGMGKFIPTVAFLESTVQRRDNEKGQHAGNHEAGDYT